MSRPSTQHVSTTTTTIRTRCCTRVPMRYCLLITCGLGLMISYADRSNMAVAIVAIGTEYNYNKSQQGAILAAFFFGYIATPIFGGTLSDHYGGRVVLAAGALLWTIFTLITPGAAALGVTWAIIVRIGLGLSEGVAFPSIHSMIGTWIPPCERSKAVAIVTAFAYFGSVIALPTSSALVASSLGWRSIFWLFGTLGVLWSIAWQIIGASNPSSSRLISKEEERWIIQQQKLEHVQNQSATSTNAQTNHDYEEQLENEDRLVRTMNSNNEAIVYQSISSIPLEQTSSRNSEGSEAPIVESGLEPSGGNQNVSMDDNRNDVSLEIPSTEAANESSKTMHRWIKFRNRKRADEFARSDTQKVPVPWKQLLCRREVWAIIVSQFCGSLGFFVMQSWVPTFYLDFFGVDVGKIGYFTVLPSAVQGAMGLCAGYLGDKAIRDWNWSPLAVRRLGQAIGSYGIGVFLLLTVKIAHTATMAMVFLTIGMALNGFTMVGASAYQHDFCPEHAGFIFSLGNTAGSMPAIFGVYFVGALLDGHGANRWDVIWTTVCVFYFVGATGFILLSTNKRYSAV